MCDPRTRAIADVVFGALELVRSEYHLSFIAEVCVGTGKTAAVLFDENGDVYQVNVERHGTLSKAVNRALQEKYAVAISSP